MTGKLELPMMKSVPLSPVRRARGGIVHIPERKAILSSLSVRDNLRIVRGNADADVVRDVLDIFPELSAKLKIRAGLLSGGEQRMLALGRAFAAKPALLLIDEMSLGLAPIVVQRLLSRIRELVDARNVGVLLVEQLAQAALKFADRSYVLNHGRIRYSGSAAELERDSQALRDLYLGEEKQAGTNAKSELDRVLQKAAEEPQVRGIN
jgi:branched-chain amino acid transport system ATP-binding protein